MKSISKYFRYLVTAGLLTSTALPTVAQSTSYAPDPDYGPGGFTKQAYGLYKDSSSLFTAGAVRADGNLLFVGQATDTFTSWPYPNPDTVKSSMIAVLQDPKTGKRISSFGFGTGGEHWNFSNSPGVHDRATDVVIGTGDASFVTGTTNESGRLDPKRNLAIYAMDKTGNTNAAFNMGTGRVVLQAYSSSGVPVHLQENIATVLSTNQQHVISTSATMDGHVFVSSISTLGRSDSLTFGQHGYHVKAKDSAHLDYVPMDIVSANGGYYIYGHTVDQANQKQLFVNHTGPDGADRNSFGNKGYIYIDMGSVGGFNEAKNIMQLQNGNFVCFAYDAINMAFASFSPVSGQLVPNFGMKGRSSLVFLTGSIFGAAAALGSDGRTIYIGAGVNHQTAIVVPIGVVNAVSALTTIDGETANPLKPMIYTNLGGLKRFHIVNQVLPVSGTNGKDVVYTAGWDKVEEVQPVDLWGDGKMVPITVKYEDELSLNVSVTPEFNRLAIVVYPNPAKNFIQVTIADDKSHAARICHWTGYSVWSGELSNDDVINIADLKLSSGVYILKVDGYDSHKLIFTR